ncbi:MAG: hypothetical protein L7U87_04375 [Chlamydiales bacterium]|nr:hypothetical protein [Chlamydiales bacterium]
MFFKRCSLFCMLSVVLFSVPVMTLELSFNSNKVQASQSFVLKMEFNHSDHAYKDLFYKKVLEQIKKQDLELISFEDNKEHYLFNINPIFPALYIFYIDYPDNLRESVVSEPLYVLKSGENDNLLSEDIYLSHLSLDEKKAEVINKSISQDYIPSSSEKITELYEKKESFKRALLIIVLFLAIACSIYIVFRFKRSKSVSSANFIDELSRKIERLREALLKDDISPREFYVELTNLLRGFLEYRIGIKALEMTTDEFLMHSLKHSPFSHSSQEVLKEILCKADMVKFAQGTINRQDGIQLLEKVKDFVHKHHVTTEE